MSYILFTLLATGIFTILDVPKIQVTLESYVSEQIAQFPERHQLDWDGSTLRANFTETYPVPFPALPDLRETPPLLLQINPAVNSDSEIAQHLKQRSFFFAGSTQLFVAQPDSQWSAMPLTEIIQNTPAQITRQTLESQKQTYISYLQSAVRLLPLIFPLFYLIITFPLRLLTVMIDTVILFLCARLMGYPLPLKKTAQISFHIMTVAELVTVLTANFTTELPMFSITFWIYTVIVYWQLRHIQALPIGVVSDQEKDQK
jgi:hypothetical protein